MLRRFSSVLMFVLGMLLAGPGVAVAAPPTDPPAVTANPFLPAEEDLTECVSAVPKPGCGSEERGGWRQVAVFGVVVVGLTFVGWRAGRTVRHNRRQLETTHGR